MTVIVFVTMLNFGMAAIGLYYRSAETRDAMLGFFCSRRHRPDLRRLDFFLFPSLDVRWI